MSKSAFYISSAMIALMAQPAFAQTEPLDDEGEVTTEIVVTGTSIRGVAPVGTNVLTVDEQSIVASGATDTNQVLASVPQVSSAFNTVPSVPSLGAAITSVTPALRKIGGSSSGGTTLVLLNGHRGPGVGVLGTPFDPGTIPVAAIQRVEVVLDGGSSVYGSDAVGGVINFITRRDFDGVELSGGYGFADDYQQYDANLIAGKSWDGGSAYIAYSHSWKDALFGRDRDYVQQISANTGSCAPGTVSIDRGGVVTTYALPDRTPGTISQCDNTDNAAFLPEETLHSVLGNIDVDLSSSLSFGLEVLYSKRTTRQTYDLNGAGGSANFAQTGIITAANPYYQPIAPDPFFQTVSFSYAGVFNDKGQVDLDLFNIAPTFTLDLGAGFEARALLSYGETRTESNSPSINAVAQEAALAGTTLDTALNPYNPGASDPDVLAGIYQNFYGLADRRQAIGRLIVDGPLFALPGGDVRVAAGLEGMQQHMDARFGNVPVGAENTAPSAVGERDVVSVFGEFVAPLFGDGNATAGLRELTLSASVRHDDYSDFGSTTNPKIGFAYSPFDGLKFRGSYGTSFNAPSLGDTTGAPDSRAQIIQFSPFRDPADPEFPNLLRPTVILAGGNPDLGPQEAETWSLGAELELGGLRASATYYNIDFRDQIAIVPFTTPAIFTDLYSSFLIRNPTLQQLTDAVGDLPLDGASSLAALYAGAFGGPYVVFDARRQNLGQVKVDGIDFAANFEQSLGDVRLDLGVTGTYLLNRKVAALSGQPLVDAVDQESRLNLLAYVGLGTGPVQGRVEVNHNSGYTLALPLTAGGVTQTEVDSFTTVDLFAAYTLGSFAGGRDARLTLNIDNIFDAEPPFYNSDPGYINGATRGRLIQVGLSIGF
ncbi:TonB-dependent receptor [Citromicrobium bathyomarinum]